MSCQRGAREGTPKKGSAVAKPRPMKLVSGNLLSANKDPPRDLGDPNSPGNQELDQTSQRADGPTGPTASPECHECLHFQEYDLVYV